MKTEEIIKYFKVTSLKKNSWQAICPCHDDHQASLTITKETKNDSTLIHCHAGCEAENILRKVNLEVKDLYNNVKKSNAPVEVERYEYTDENDKLVHCKIRYKNDFGKKTFKQGSYKNSKFEYSLKGIKTYLYKLPELIEDISHEREIFIVEGEKDVNNLRELGVAATTSPMGAGKWRREYNRYFKDAKVVIIPDNDEPGSSHANLVYQNIKDVAYSVKILNLDVREKGDVSDWLEARKGITELYSLVANTQTVDKFAETVSKIKEQLNEEKEKNEIEEIMEFIYTQGDRLRVIHEHVLIKLLEKYIICVTVTGNKKRYFVFDDGYWKEKRKDQIAALYFKWLKPIDRTNKMVESITDVLFYMDNVAVDDHIFNSKDNKINLQNCTYNLETFKPEPHKPEDYFTYKSDYPYIENAQCPLFMESLRMYSLGSEDWIKAFFEITGYAMTGTFDIQKMFWFTGSKGRNGKGTCIRVIENLVGDTFTVSDIDTRDFREKFYKLRLKEKRLATAGDLHNRVANVATLKQLTGGDKQMADVKFGDPISFTNHAKFIFAMNQLPQLHPDENITPIAKRIFILPFDNEIKNPNSEIESKILKELSGIFNLAIDGLKRLLKNKDFTNVERGNTVLQMFQKDLSVSECFIEDNLEYDANYEDGIFLYNIFDSYVQYLDEIFAGNNWRYDKEIKEKNSKDLGRKISKYFSERGADIEKKKVTDNIKKGTQIKYFGLKFIE